MLKIPQKTMSRLSLSWQGAVDKGDTVVVSDIVGKPEVDGGVPGIFCTSEDETNWNKRSYVWHEGRSIQRSRL